MANYRKRLKRLYLRVVTAKGSPRQVAAGLAVGVFWGLSPLWLLQTLLALVSATALNVSRIPAAIGVHISNPITAPFIYPITWKVGDFLLRPFVGAAQMAAWEGTTFSWDVLPGLAGHALTRMLLGGFVLGAVLGIMTYLLALLGLVRFKKAIKMRRKARQLKRSAAQASASRASGPATEEQPTTLTKDDA